MEHQSAVLLRRLNPYCARALEGAASLCQTRAHAEILPEHWVLKLLEQGEGDLTVLARRYEWDMDAIWQDLLAYLDHLPRSVRGRPQLSDSLESLLKQAWLCASLEGNEQIRGAHLLAAMIDRPQSPALRLQIMAACYSAIQKWEPRISLTAIAFERSESDGTLYVDITGTRPSSDRSFSLTISLS